MTAPVARTDSLTPSQTAAVQARGNVLVMAGAGTGKTKTLIERCLDCLARDGAALDELLIVTFTEAAAAELRERLRQKLAARATAEPDNPRWPEEIARFELAHIGTLHSFCLRLVREHFYELDLDPQLAILDEGAARQLASETLAEQFAAHYAGAEKFSSAVQELIQIHGGGRDEAIQQLILRLHHYSQTRPNAADWLRQQREIFSSAKPTDWQNWLLTAIADWRAEWLAGLGAPACDPTSSVGVQASACSPDRLKPELQRAAPVADASANNEKAAELVGVLSRLPKNFSREAAAEVLAQITAADGNWPTKRKTVLRKPLENIFAEAEFLQSLAAVKNGTDPLAEDWSWVRGQMETILRLAEEFAGKFAEAKRAAAGLDFHDLEQFALKLLWNFATDKPTAVADHWRAKLKFVFVDEYQDINAAQDKIIAALSRDGSDANRFLVGDVKQSIYRFRLADPQIFRDYARSWVGQSGQTIALAENFRSREGLLKFVNSVCRLVMRGEVGGVNYDATAELKFGGKPVAAGELDRPDAGPATACAELLVRFKNGRTENPEDEVSDLASLGDAEREARLVAGRLKQMVETKHEIFDDKKKLFRPVAWRDIAILLRSPRGKAEIFAKEFERAGIPLAVARGGFYETAEILDLLSLLQLLDNPLQDVPCLAVLRSPLVGLSLDELAEIRLAAREKNFWTALNRFHALAGDTHFPLTPALSPEEREKRSQPFSGTTMVSGTKNLQPRESVQQLSPLPEGEGQGEGKRGATSTANPNQIRLAEKASMFLDRFSRWRKLARQVSLSQCLEEILAETLYADWLRAQPRGAQRAANVASFVQLAQKFDQFQRQGLFRFLKFIEAQQSAEAEPEVSATPTEDAVRLMSIHQSKGLEFPVVVLADLAKKFNETDLRGEIIFDEQFGLCPKVKPPHTGRRYPSLPHWLAQRRQKRELRGEELRLLYVALTRARDNLILTASVTEKSWDEKWCAPQTVTPQRIAAGNSFADWLALWFGMRSAECGARQDSLPELRWQIVADADFGGTPVADPAGSGAGDQRAEPVAGAPAETAIAELRARLEGNYPAAAATKQKAKSSVTELRRAAEETDDEAEPVFPCPPKSGKRKAESGISKLSAAETGTAHHKFLEHFALAQAGDLAAEADRLVRENYLTTEERSVLDLAALAAFWDSALGKKIVAHAAQVRRELPFTARFIPADLEKITGKKAEPGLENEFIVVQGVADLAVILDAEIWLVDFKTDAVGKKDLAAKVKDYRPQLELYAAALKKIFSRKVTLRALHFLAAGWTEKV